MRGLVEHGQDVGVELLRQLVKVLGVIVAVVRRRVAGTGFAPRVRQNTTISTDSSSTKPPPTGPSQRAICAPGSSFAVGSGGGTIFGMA